MSRKMMTVVVIISIIAVSVSGYVAGYNARGPAVEKLSRELFEASKRAAEEHAALLEAEQAKEGLETAVEDERKRSKKLLNECGIEASKCIDLEARVKGLEEYVEELKEELRKAKGAKRPPMGPPPK